MNQSMLTMEEVLEEGTNFGKKHSDLLIEHLLLTTKLQSGLSEINLNEVTDASWSSSLNQDNPILTEEPPDVLRFPLADLEDLDLLLELLDLPAGIDDMLVLGWCPTGIGRNNPDADCG